MLANAKTPAHPLLGVLLLTLVFPVSAQDKPYWELGAGAAAISFPDYVGSDNRNNWLLPIPYVVYRSARVEVDRDSVSGKLFESDRLKLELSLGGSLPVDSDDNDERRGMPDLDPILEFGPALTYEMYRIPSSKDRILFELPIRTVIASDLKSIDYVGWTSNPTLKYEGKRYVNDASWKLEAGIGPLFGNRRYHDYFYQVESRFATPERPAFEVSGGFGGWRASLGFSRREGHLWYGGFVRYINIADAEFSASPLVKTEHAVMGGMALAWIFSTSRDSSE